MKIEETTLFALCSPLDNGSRLRITQHVTPYLKKFANSLGFIFIGLVVASMSKFPTSPWLFTDRALLADYMVGLIAVLVQGLPLKTFGDLAQLRVPSLEVPSDDD
ncbi:hypothetical protein CVT26_008298 [Gymnopilus dilepis]|uniref:Uncharacterized protein n=1 Tax=Gymnopilus dilepis TaxID=231916 RepID=A0A409W9F4_9AGAR|nr:hypothetical protein CVT26_008298 [Gymnopilus dilepis]